MFFFKALLVGAGDIVRVWRGRERAGHREVDLFEVFRYKSDSVNH